MNCINEFFEKGEMSSSQKQAIITLIEKKGKDRSLLENWRPISLVNVDTKIMTKAIASRIKNVLPDIIHPNQTGYVKDRFIGETIRSIYDVMDFTVACVASVSVLFRSKERPRKEILVLAAREMKREAKNERGGRGRRVCNKRL